MKQLTSLELIGKFQTGWSETAIKLGIKSWCGLPQETPFLKCFYLFIYLF